MVHQLLGVCMRCSGKLMSGTCARRTSLQFRATKKHMCDLKHLSVAVQGNSDLHSLFLQPLKLQLAGALFISSAPYLRWWPCIAHMIGMKGPRHTTC